MLVARMMASASSVIAFRARCRCATYLARRPHARGDDDEHNRTAGRLSTAFRRAGDGGDAGRAFAAQAFPQARRQGDGGDGKMMG